MLSRKGSTFVPCPPAPLSARDRDRGVGRRGSTQRAGKERAEPHERTSIRRSSLKQPGMAFPCPPTLDALLGQHWKDLQTGYSDYESLNKVLEFQSDELQWTSQKWGTDLPVWVAVPGREGEGVQFLGHGIRSRRGRGWLRVGWYHNASNSLCSGLGHFLLTHFNQPRHTVSININT